MNCATGSTISLVVSALICGSICTSTCLPITRDAVPAWAPEADGVRRAAPRRTIRVQTAGIVHTSTIRGATTTAFARNRERVIATQPRANWSRIFAVIACARIPAYVAAGPIGCHWVITVGRRTPHALTCIGTCSFTDWTAIAFDPNRVAALDWWTVNVNAASAAA